MEKKLLALFSALLAAWTVLPEPASAGQERWKVITGKSAEDRIIYDPDSVIPSGPMRFRVWVAGFDADGFPRKTLEEFDCTNRIVRDAEVVAEKPNRPPIRTITPSAWRGIVRESPRGDLYKILCR